MKRIIFVTAVLLLTITAFTAGCTKKSPAPVVPTQNITGVLKNVTENSQAGQGTITIQNPQGSATLPVGPNTTFFLNGQACTIDQLAALQVANVSYNCTTVFYMDENGQMVTVGVNVTKTVP